jgi:prephenate dehydrogenase
VVMDVCSVKTLPCQWLNENFKEPVEIMGTHPMFGPDSAKSGLKGKQIVLCPLRISSQKLNEIKNIFQKLELEVIETTPEDHDQQTAYSLALVHFLGRGLEKLDFDKINIKTYGFDIISQIRENVSNDSWQLFEDMQKLNPYSEEVREIVLESLKEVDSSLDQ